MRRPLTALGVAGVVVILVVVVVAAPTWVVALTVGTDVLTGTEWASAVAEERKTILFVLGGLIAAGGLWYTRQRQELDRDANRTSRFGAAVDQIGSDAAEVRMGGLYSLERIARDSLRDRAVVTEVISAFVRSRTYARVDEIKALKEDWRLLALTVDVRAALSILTRQRAISGDTKPNLEWAVFSRSELEKIDFSDLNLAQGRFSEAVVSELSMARASLAYANFHKASLFDVDFTDSEANGATFTEAKLHNCAFTNANLGGASFQKTSFGSGCRFEGADLTWADFSDIVTSKPLDLTRAASVANLVIKETDLTNIVLTDEQRAVIRIAGQRSG